MQWFLKSHSISLKPLPEVSASRGPTRPLAPSVLISFSVESARGTKIIKSVLQIHLHPPLEFFYSESDCGGSIILHVFDMDKKTGPHCALQKISPRCPNMLPGRSLCTGGNQACSPKGHGTDSCRFLVTRVLLSLPNRGWRMRVNICI